MSKFERPKTYDGPGYAKAYGNLSARVDTALEALDLLDAVIRSHGGKYLVKRIRETLSGGKGAAE